MTTAKKTTERKAPVRRRNTSVTKGDEDVKEEVEDVKEVEEVEELTDEEVEVEEKETTKSPNVRIKPNKDYRTFIGDRWFNFKKGKVESVPQHVKEILYKAGVLDTL